MSFLTRSLALYPAVLGLILVLAACGGSKAAPTPTTSDTTTSPIFPSLTPVSPSGLPAATSVPSDPLGLNEEKMLALLTLDEVQSLVSLPVVASDVRDSKSLAEAENPERVAAMDSWYTRYFASEDGHAILLSVFDYRFPSAAQGQFSNIVLELGLTSTFPIIGDGSAEIEFEGEVIDGVIVFYKGDRYILLQSVVLNEMAETRLIDLGGLRELAKLIVLRL